jgi:ectoine hydrolase
VAEIYDAAIHGRGEHWGDYTAIVPLIGAGSDAAAPHLTWTGEPFGASEGIFLELAGTHRRYHCPMSRTFYIGKPDQKLRDTEKAVHEGLEAGLDKAKPAIRAGTSPSDSMMRSFGTASRKRAARAIPSACPIPLIGASTHLACVVAIAPN